MEPLGMFELSKIGLPLLAISLSFLVFLGENLLPNREALSDIISDLDSKEFLTEAIVQIIPPCWDKKLKILELANFPE